MIRRTIQFALALLVLAVSAQRLSAADSWRIKTDPVRLVNGSPVLFRVTAPVPLTALHGTWSDRELSFRFTAACNCWYAIAGIDLNQKPGKYPLTLEGTQKDGSEARFAAQLPVLRKAYPTTRLTVPPQYVEPPPEVKARIQEEAELKKQVFTPVAKGTYWSGPFEPPVATSVTAVFGSSRTLNGVSKARHQGLDFRAAEGTTVRAANSGVVILARNLYYEGNCVVIDHGQGFLTLYFHFSEISVKEGERVKTGDVLGKSGATGRVNGPHLHFAARWQGLYLDPETLLKLNVP